MNKDREMILKMLKDGKVTVEEAEALLQVLDEAAEEGAATRKGAAQSHRSGRADEAGVAGSAHREHQRETGGQGSGFRFDQDFDFSFIGETVKKSLSGLKDTIRDAMEGIKDVDIEAEIKRAFGKEKGHAETELEVSSEEVTAIAVPSSAGETGDVTLYRSDDRTIRVYGAVTSWGSDKEAAQSRAEAVTLAAILEEGIVTLSADTGEGEGLRRVRVDYRIAVPSSISVQIDTVSGDVTAEDVDGYCRMSTISGDVGAYRIGGDVTIRTNSGDISIEDAPGPVECDSKSGDVTVEGVRQAAKVSSISGDIEVEMAEATPGGPVDGETLDVGPIEIELRSISGDIELSTPANAGFRLEVNTTSGAIQCDAPVEAERRSRTQLAGTIGDGAGTVRVATVSGDVEIS